MTARVRRRKTRDRRGLSQAEGFHLLTGIPTWDRDEEAFSFPDEAEARAAWADHGHTVTPRPGLTPWAAIVFDGAPGHSSAYCHLGNPRCGCRR